MRLLLCFLIAIAFGCNDTDLLVAPDDSGETSLAKRDQARMIPLKGQGVWEWDGTFLEPTERCAVAGGNASTVYTGFVNVTHLGRSDVHMSACIDLTAWANIYTLETWTAPNGDKLVLYEQTRQGTERPIPAGSDFGFDFVVESGTGRFAGAAGEGLAHGTIVFDPPGAGGVYYLEGVISSVGTSQ